jgi:predicted metal-dependent hydrolase|tara:strand:- start:151 stop:285 length:135 start_codon:yes stop_codon:yes gene_type:complete
MKTNYDKLFNVLAEWYNEKQIEEIWELLKKYDKTIKTKKDDING